MSAHQGSETNSSIVSSARSGLMQAERRWALALALGPAVLVVLLVFPTLDLILHSAEIHLLVVSLCALITLALAGAVLNAARRFGDGRALLVGAAFLVIAAIISIHAIATPNVIFVGRFEAVSWSGLLSLMLGGMILAVSSLPISPGQSDWLVRSFWLWLGLLGLAWAAYATLVLVLLPPSSAAGAHYHVGFASINLQTWGGLLGLAAYGLAVWRYGRWYRRRPSEAGLALIGGVVLLGEALLTQMLATSFALSFWLYHLLEFAGCAALAVGVLLGLREGAPGAGLLEYLLLPGTTARLREGYAHALEMIVEDLERGAAPSRATTDALRLRFGLGAAQLAVFERAAQAVAEERQRRRQIEELNAGLQQLEQDRDQLTQLIVHDLKNPITAIAGYMDLLRLNGLNSDQAELVEFSRRSIAGLRALVDDLLDVGRLEAGRMELQYGPVDLARLLARCAEELAHWAVLDDKQMIMEAAPDLPTVSADRRLLERLILNLLSNAIKHTPPGTTIRLRSAPAGPALVALEVADNGPGIPAERLATIFTKYTSGAEGGRQRNSGLGLTLCRLVAEAHGGHISAYSCPGEGTVFRVELPT